MFMIVLCATLEALGWARMTCGASTLAHARHVNQNGAWGNWSQTMFSVVVIEMLGELKGSRMFIVSW